jgi:hypothetical protein
MPLFVDQIGPHHPCAGYKHKLSMVGQHEYVSWPLNSTFFAFFAGSASLLEAGLVISF